MIQPKCPICGLDLLGNEGKDADGKIIEEQVKYWMHDPRNLHVDFETSAHKICFDKIKIDYPDFDQPKEDYATYQLPTIDGKGLVVLKTPLKYKTDFDALIKAEKDALAIKPK